MYLTQELAIPRRAELEWPELRTYPPLRWTPQILSSAYIKKEPVASTAGFIKGKLYFLAPLSTSLAGSQVQEPARLAVRSISYRDSACVQELVIPAKCDFIQVIDAPQQMRRIVLPEHDSRVVAAFFTLVCGKQA